MSEQETTERAKDSWPPIEAALREACTRIRAVSTQLDELLAACKSMLAMLSSFRVPQNAADAALQITFGGPVIESARAAIAKAEDTAK